MYPRFEGHLIVVGARCWHYIHVADGEVCWYLHPILACCSSCMSLAFKSILIVPCLEFMNA